MIRQKHMAQQSQSCETCIALIRIHRSDHGILGFLSIARILLEALLNTILKKEEQKSPNNGNGTVI